MWENKQVGDKQAELDDLTAQTAAVEQQIAALQALRRDPGHAHGHDLDREGHL